jgi:RNA polymerase-binding transcription factor DksA
MMSLSIMENLERRLQSIGHALSKMDRGQGELCERCGRPIEPERLKVLPDTTLCVKCKVELEREG